MTSHGRAGYGRGCRCYVCGWAASQYASRRSAAVAAGQWRPFVDAAPVRQHLHRLSAMGIGLGSVSSASGVSIPTIQGIRNGRSKRVRPDIAAALLAVAPIHDMAEPGVLVDAQQTRDRIEMLIGRGWTQQRVSVEAGVSLSSVERLRAGRHSRIRAATANRIAYVGVCQNGHDITIRTGRRSCKECRRIGSNLIRNVREVR